MQGIIRGQRADGEYRAEAGAVASERTQVWGCMAGWRHHSPRVTKRSGRRARGRPPGYPPALWALAPRGDAAAVFAATQAPSSEHRAPTTATGQVAARWQVGCGDPSSTSNLKGTLVLGHLRRPSSSASPTGPPHTVIPRPPPNAAVTALTSLPWPHGADQTDQRPHGSMEHEEGVWPEMTTRPTGAHHLPPEPTNVEQGQPP
jgi:hypothetical protein